MTVREYIKNKLPEIYKKLKDYKDLREAYLNKAISKREAIIVRLMVVTKQGLL